MEKDKDKDTIRTSRVHKVLANAYLTYFLALFLGLILSAIFPARIFTDSCLLNWSAVLLILSTALIFWAQKSTRKFNKENVTKNSFKKGPYKYTMHPTSLGLFLSMFSFGVIINSIFVILFAFVSFLLSRLIFIKKEEDILIKKYGHAYLEYKKDVKF
jgi:protein-S-isoprenylcysteine O-methyltransferase Ste14